MTKDDMGAIATECLKLARDLIIVNMRFLDVALLRLPFEENAVIERVATDGKHFYYNPQYILDCYKKETPLVARIYLHSLMHCVFNHAYGYDRLKNTHFWDLACDIAIENLLMELNVPGLSLEDDDLRRMRLRGLKKNVKDLTAQKIYRHFLINDLAREDDREYMELFAVDSHVYFREPENYEISENDWKKISERIKTEIKSFSKTSGDNEALIKNLTEATKDRPNLRDILSHFVDMGEQMSINDDEFDYIYYTYGMKLYGDIPFIEPLEYKDVKKIRDFVIVIDTSASCQGHLVRQFLKYTKEIMVNRDSFFDTVNVHIIQCDNEIQSDVKITCEEEFDNFLVNGKLKGFGGTDFRPAFSYVDNLIEKKEFKDLKGMIYFTDGYGIYPEKAPEYDAMFVFLNDDERRMPPPWWAIRVEIEEEALS